MKAGIKRRSQAPPDDALNSMRRPRLDSKDVYLDRGSDVEKEEEDDDDEGAIAADEKRTPWKAVEQLGTNGNVVPTTGGLQARSIHLAAGNGKIPYAGGFNGDNLPNALNGRRRGLPAVRGVVRLPVSSSPAVVERQLAGGDSGPTPVAGGIHLEEGVVAVGYGRSTCARGRLPVGRRVVEAEAMACSDTSRPRARCRSRYPSCTGDTGLVQVAISSRRRRDRRSHIVTSGPRRHAGRGGREELGAMLITFPTRATGSALARELAAPGDALEQRLRQSTKSVNILLLEALARRLVPAKPTNREAAPSERTSSGDRARAPPPPRSRPAPFVAHLAAAAGVRDRVPAAAVDERQHRRAGWSMQIVRACNTGGTARRRRPRPSRRRPRPAPQERDGDGPPSRAATSVRAVGRRPRRSSAGPSWRRAARDRRRTEQRRRRVMPSSRRAACRRSRRAGCSRGRP